MKLSEINGWDENGPKKKPVNFEDYHAGDHYEINGHNACLEFLEKLDVGMDKEELARCLYGIDGYICPWEDQYSTIRHEYFKEANAIIANQAKILKICPAGKKENENE